MTQDLIDAAVELADALARENEALTRLDLARAAAMLAAKRRAAEAFEQARSAANRGPAAGKPKLVRTVEEQLAALAEENRALLERAIRVQRRVIGTIAEALPRAASAGRYRADGVPAAGRKVPAFALSARA
ncbi:MAG: hypothetical protein M0002_00185 [Rhodospirillales bacterium]|nr:hypothetical protein [Rhodospirillales bacterium]